MKRAIVIKQDLGQIDTIEGLTGIFEGIASIKIAKVRNRVIASKDFFAELWQTYRGLRVDREEQLARKGRAKTGKSVLVAVTTEGRLSGDLGNKVIEELLATYSRAKDTDIIVLGSQGGAQLRLHGVSASKVYSLPEGDEHFDTTEVMEELAHYDHISVFYQTYESLRVQRVVSIELVSAVRQLSDAVEEDKGDKAEIVSSHEFIFEPGIAEIADYLETLMMGVALNQVLMESKLSQHASRFNTMNAAKHRAHDMKHDYDLMFHRAKRAENDERLKEVMSIVKSGLL